MNLTEYEKSGRALYAEFAAAVAAILRAALTKEGNLNVQLVTTRAKDVGSLAKKLADREILDSQTIETEIKDLAGCRIVLYTNTDVARLSQSRLIHENFDVLEVKVHEPGMKIVDANDLYQSNHFIVALKQNRAELPEYSAFVGLRCEIQVQTILNHSWAQMAHDTSYKSPTLDRFGQKALQAVTARLYKVMTNYLLPAGHEFDKITADFNRLAAGKALFDQRALDAIGTSENNNDRAEAIETFVDQVMPLYDDLSAEYRGIVKALIDAVQAARQTAPVPRTAYFGSLPGITSDAITKSVSDVLSNYRYIDIGITFAAICELYASAVNDEEKKALKKAGEQLAKHQMRAWEAVGPGVQEDLVNRIEALDPDLSMAVAPLLTVMLKEVLGSEVTGTTSNSSSVTFHTGSVIISDTLIQVRRRATGILQKLFMATRDEDEQKAILAAMAEATRAPYGARYGNDLAKENALAAAALLQFERGQIATLPNQLRESLEDRALRFFRTYKDLPKSFKDDEGVASAAAAVVTAALTFRDALNADADFVTFKTLVGFEGVFPPAWENEAFQWQAAEAYRREKVEEFIADVTPQTRELWLERIERYASTKSGDLATFPMFGHFLSRLGEQHPDIGMDYLARTGPSLSVFGHCLINGVMKSGNRAGEAFIRGWIAEGKNLQSVARYLTYADPFDPAFLADVSKEAIERNDADALKIVVAAAERQFRQGYIQVVTDSFLPALHHFYDCKDLRWVDQFVPWLGSPIIQALPEDEARIMLNALVPYPEIEHNAEYLVTGLARNWPAAVLDFFSDRIAFAEQRGKADEEQGGQDDGDDDDEADKSRFQAFPFSIHQLGEPLRSKPKEVIEAARNWYTQRPELFRFGGGHIVAAIFKGAEDTLASQLGQFAESGDEDDARFILSILHSFEGSDPAFALTRSIVSRFEPGSGIHDEAKEVLTAAGVLSGEFGTAEMLEERKDRVAEWIADTRPVVSQIATAFVKSTEQRIASERRTARARIAQRRLDHGEDPDILGSQGTE